jgi:hypothetical protein
MPRDVDRASLYRAPINLWVEDEITKAYLEEIWGGPDIAYLIGGGNEGVTAILNDAEKAGYRNVFGVIDRDFRPTNEHSWNNPRKTFLRFILPVHEIENYLLDPHALRACRFNTMAKTEVEIEAMMREEAKRRVTCEACRWIVALLSLTLAIFQVHKWRASLVQ